MKIKTLPIAASLLLASTQVSSGGIPVIDVTNIFQTTVSAIEAVSQTQALLDQINNQVTTINQLRDQYNSLTGNYNIGQLLNTPADLNAKRFIPRNWQETLSILEAGGLPGFQNEAQQAARDARERGQRYTATDLYGNPDLDVAKRYLKQGERIFSAAGISQATYNSTEKRFGNIETLNNEIDNANDLKAATDLNNRLLVENASLQNELIRQISIMNIQQAEIRQQQYNDKAADRQGMNVAPFEPY